MLEMFRLFFIFQRTHFQSQTNDTNLSLGSSILLLIDTNLLFLPAIAILCDGCSMNAKHVLRQKTIVR